MLNTALEYLEMGFSVIPVKRSDKKPYLKSWKEYQKRLPTEEEIERWWMLWPNANIAIITGKVSGIIIVDADGPVGIQWMADNLQKTTVYNQTYKGVHGVYKNPQNAVIKNMVRLAPEVDIRGEGGYFISPPSVHQSGHVYKWVFLLDGWADLPEYQPPSSIGKSDKKKTGNLNIDLSRIASKLDTNKIEAGIPQGERDNLLFREACRLRGKNLTLEEAWLLLKSFADRCDPPFTEKETRTKLSQAWKYEPDDPEIGASIECFDLNPAKLCEKQPEIPETILKPGGLLQDIMDYIDVSSAAAVPYFALAAAIALVGNILGHRVMTETGLRTNMYVITLGYSGSGKSSPVGALKNILLRSSAVNTIGITELTSAQAIFKELSLENKRVTLMLLDEIGLVLSGLKSPNSPAREVPRLLMKLFSNTTGIERKAFAANDDIVVPYSHLSLYGASTPERFYESISGDELSDGFLARILLFESHHDAPYPKKNIKKDIPYDLIDKINSLHPPIIFDATDGNLLGRKPKPKMIGMSQQADEYHETFKRKYHDLKNESKADGFGKSTIYGRAAEHASKLALIHTMSLNGANCSLIDMVSIEWAWILIEYIIENTVANIKTNVFETLFEKQRNKILKEMRAKGIQEEYKNGLTIRDLTRGPCRGMTSKDVKELINTLIIAGEIGVYREKARNNREVIKYFAAR